MFGGRLRPKLRREHADGFNLFMRPDKEVAARGVGPMRYLFCATCGGRLFIDVAARNLRGANGFLLPAETFRPQFHVNCRFAVLPVRDGLTHYAGMPVAFGGSDETVDW